MARDNVATQVLSYSWDHGKWPIILFLLLPLSQLSLSTLHQLSSATTTTVKINFILMMLPCIFCSFFLQLKTQRRDNPMVCRRINLLLIIPPTIAFVCIQSLKTQTLANMHLTDIWKAI
jgi:hypothetical protein